MPTVAVFVHNYYADRWRGTATESDERENREINRSFIRVTGLQELMITIIIFNDGDEADNYLYIFV